MSTDGNSAIWDHLCKHSSHNTHVKELVECHYHTWYDDDESSESEGEKVDEPKKANDNCIS